MVSSAGGFSQIINKGIFVPPSIYGKSCDLVKTVANTMAQEGKHVFGQKNGDISELPSLTDRVTPPSSPSATELESKPVSPEEFLRTHLSSSPLNVIPMGVANLKYLGKGVALLKTITKSEEDQLIAGTERKYVEMSRSNVILCAQNQPVFLYTDGLVTCVAALAFCQLAGGKCLMGCAHLSSNHPYYTSQLRALIDKINEHPSYHGEEVLFYLAGGRSDDIADSFNSREIDIYCDFLYNNRTIVNLKLKGVLLDPYQISSAIVHKLEWPHTSEEMISAKIADPAEYERLYQERMAALQITSLFSCRAGITSNGLPLVRKLVDISFAYDSKKYPTYKEIIKHCS